MFLKAGSLGGGGRHDECESASNHICSPGSLDAPGWPGGIAPAPLLPGEDEAEYAKFTAQFLAAAKPRDFIEEILARDAIDLSWEILRLRRLKAGLLRMACGAGVRSVAEKLGYKPLKWIAL